MSLDCKTCVLAKSHKRSYLPSFSHSTSPFSLIDSDVWGPAPTFATYNYSYYVLFVDDCTRMSWVYFLKYKSKVFSVFVIFFIICSKLNIMQNHKFYDLIMRRSLLTQLCNNLCLNMESFTKPVVLTHPNNMALQNAKSEPYSKSLELFYLSPIPQFTYGLRPSPQLLISPTAVPLNL